MVVDLFLVYSFLKRLATPFKEWKAFDLGIIDEDGNILKKRKDFTTIDEKDAFGVFDIMILKLKTLLGKIPGGKSKLASYAAALWLIKEGQNFDENMDDLLIEQQIISNMKQLNESDYLNMKFEEIVNTSAGGNIAGLPPDQPVVFKQTQRMLLRRNKKKKNV